MSVAKDSDDATKVKMLEALVKKHKNNNVRKISGPSSGSKISQGQTGGAAPKMHRRKSGSD